MAVQEGVVHISGLFDSPQEQVATGVAAENIAGCAALRWIRGISWSDSKVSVKMTRKAIDGDVAYVPGAPLDRVQEALLYEHYGHPVYWADHVVRDLEISRM